MIYSIRGKQVKIDSDLAILYKCANGTKTLNLAVKRNIDRFPERFCFRLTEEEYKKILKNSVYQRFQFETASRRNKRYLPFVFTEQGIAMLSSVLRTSVATEISIKIMDTFVEMRKFLTDNKNLLERVITIENIVNNKFLDYDEKFDELFDLLQKEKDFNHKIFFNGQIYDAYSLIVNLIGKAKIDIIIIDNYVDKTTLDLLSKKRDTVINVTIITNKNNLKLTSLDVNKFNMQYPLLD